MFVSYYLSHSVENPRYFNGQVIAWLSLACQSIEKSRQFSCIEISAGSRHGQSQRDVDSVGTDQYQTVQRVDRETVLFSMVAETEGVKPAA